MDGIKREALEKFGELRFIPLIFTSVTEKQRLFKALDLATQVYANRKSRIPTSELNDFFKPFSDGILRQLMLRTYDDRNR